MNQHNPMQERKVYFSAEGMHVNARNLSYARQNFLNLVNSIAEDDKERGKIWRLHIFL